MKKQSIPSCTPQTPTAVIQDAYKCFLALFWQWRIRRWLWCARSANLQWIGDHVHWTDLQ